MSSAGGSAGNEGGFTLLELLVVMLIVSLTTIAIAAALPRTTSGPSIELAATRLAAGFKKARMRAISRETTIAVTIDPEGRRYRLGQAGPVASLPGDVGFASLSSTIIRFYPDGGADPGMVRLTVNQQTRRIDVSPMTGQVTIH